MDRKPTHSEHESTELAAKQQVTSKPAENGPQSQVLPKESSDAAESADKDIGVEMKKLQEVCMKRYLEMRERQKQQKPGLESFKEGDKSLDPSFSDGRTSGLTPPANTCVEKEAKEVDSFDHPEIDALWYVLRHDPTKEWPF